MSHEYIYKTIDIERRGYGRRYSGLPVDDLSRDGFSIDFTETYTRPDMIDILPGDTVRWREGERLIEATIAGVRRESALFQASVENAHPLPPDAFYP